jgi:hypothetical protein
MTFTVNNVLDNPFQPGALGYAYTPDQLIAGPMQRVTQNVMVMAGVLARGTVIGRQTNFSFVATHGTNTGNGTVGTITPGANTLTGGYALVATSATVFTVTDPEGNALPNATVGSAYTNAALNFTITAGGTAFVAGDSFTFTSYQTTGNCIVCVKNAGDGSQTPIGILADAVDASAGPAFVGAYLTGEFNINAVIMDASWTGYDMMAALQPRNIHLKSAVIAADPVNP